MYNEKHNLIPVICYKLKQPRVYNRGTRYETSEDSFLSYYTTGDLDRARAEATELNDQRPAKNRFGYPINWDDISYFYADEQEMMEG